MSFINNKEDKDMRIAQAQVGQELIDKISGIAYKVDATEKSTEGTVTKATATEILDEGDEREPKSATITAENDITFRVTKWIRDEEIHSARIEDGVLVVDSKKVQMGSIKALNLLKTFPGTVVFEAEKEGNENYNTVMSYMPSRDKFSNLGMLDKQAELVDTSDTRAIYASSLTKEIEEKDGDEVKKVTVFDRAEIFVLTNGRLVREDLIQDSCDYDEEEYDDEYDEYDEDERYLREGFLGFDLKGCVMAQGDKYLYIPMIDDENGIAYRVVRVTNTASIQDDVVMPGKLTAVTGNRTSARELGKAIFSGEGYVKIGSYVAKSDDLKGYIYLVDVREKDDVYTYVLSTEERQTRTITRKVTADRGEIIEIA